MRIAFVIDQISRGGTETQTARIAGSIAMEGHDVSMFVLRPESPDVADMHEQLVGAGVKLDIDGGRHAWSSALRLTRLRSWLHRLSPDVVHAAMTRSGLVCSAPSMLPGSTPLVLTRRYIATDQRDRSPILRHASRAALGRSTLILANSHRAAEASAAYEAMPITKYRVIPNCLDQSAFDDVEPSYLETDIPIVLSVANLRPVKDHRTLVEALGILKRAGHAVQGLFVGNGDQREAIVELARREGLTIWLPGRSRDPRPYLRGCAVFVQSSTTEGMSNSLLEAMAAGCPIVATDVGGTAEALEGSGLLVPPRDPKRMSEAISRILADSDLANDMGSRARSTAQKYSVAAATERHLTLYEECLALESRRSD